MSLNSFDLIIKNAKVVLPENKNNFLRFKTTQVDVGICNGKISELGSLSLKTTQATIDAQGLHLIPGCIDSHVHFREPGLTHKEDLSTGSKAAILGGVTTVFEMPNTLPPTTSEAAFIEKMNLAQKRSWCNYSFFIGATPENISELSRLEKKSGCAGIKVFMGSSTHSCLIESESDLLGVLKNTHRRVVAHCEDEKLLKEKKYLAKKVGDHPLWRNESTALHATSQFIRLAQNTNHPVHVLHVTTQKELELIKVNKNLVTAECLVQSLTLHAPDCYERLGTKAQMNPPLRDIHHQKALWKALLDGTIDIISSDHAPHTLEEKNKPYPESPSGMPGVQTTLPLMLNHVNNGRLSLEHLVKLFCANPARIFGLKNKGLIQEGYDADLTLIDLAQQRKIENKWMASRCGWTPYDEMLVHGWPQITLINGVVVMKDDQILGEPQGAPALFNEY